MQSIFVFGSNLAGRHGKGAALYARDNYGAIYGVGEGIQGQSYAIPTKDRSLNPRSLGQIADSIMRFIQYAHDHPEKHFRVTPVGCGLAGFKRSEIKPLFRLMPSNCTFSTSWNDE